MRFHYLLSIPAAIVFSGATLAAQIRQSPADTGRMAWGHKDFTPYTSADYCDRAIMETGFNLKRAYFPDTVRDIKRLQEMKPQEPVMPAEMIATAKACGSRFTVDNVDPRELYSLMRISIVLGNEAQAQAAFERALSQRKTALDSAYTLATAAYTRMSDNLPVKNLELGRAYLKRLDALGPVAKVQQYGIRIQFLKHWREQYEVDSMRTYANQAIELSKTMSSAELDVVALTEPYDQLIDLANEEGDLDLQQKIFDQALEYAGGWRQGNGQRWITGKTTLLETRRNLYGKKTKPLDGTFWINNNGVPRPVPGKTSLLLKVNHLCGTKCYPFYKTIRQLQQQYDLDVTFISSTQGYAAGTGPLTSAEESQIASDYFTKFLKFPVSVLIDETPTYKIDDGRIIRQTSKLAAVFANWNGVNAVLIDKTGAVRWMGGIGLADLRFEDMKDDLRMIDKALKRTIAAGEIAAQAEK